MTMTVGAATDYIYALAQAAVAGVRVEGQPAQAHDGFPPFPVPGMFVVGLELPPPDLGDSATHVTREWYGVGGKRLEEDYTIPCYIDVRVEGTVQKTPRDAAEAIFNTFWTSLAADLTLGGILTSGRLADIADLTFQPGELGTVGEPGRRQLVTFGVHCRNLTT